MDKVDRLGWLLAFLYAVQVGISIWILGPKNGTFWITYYSSYGHSSFLRGIFTLGVQV